jgi:hypothetical protein
VGANTAEGINVRLLCAFYVVYVAVLVTSLIFVQRGLLARASACVCVCLRAHLFV